MSSQRLGALPLAHARLFDAAASFCDGGFDERERLRGDRRIGLAEDQARRVHIGCIYDLELDTAIATADACAREIAAALATSLPPQR